MQIDWLTVAAQIVNFLVLVWLLQRFLYRPIVEAMARREQRIEGRLSEAKAARDAVEAEARRLRERQEALEARREEFLESARREAVELRARLQEEIHAEMEAERRSWHARLEEERAAFSDRLRRHAGRQVIEIVGRVLEDYTGSDLAGQLASTFADRLDGMEPETRARLARAAARAEGPAVVDSGLALKPAARSRITRAIHDCLGRELDVSYREDPELLLGVRLSVGEQTVEWSAARFLQRLENTLDEVIDGSGHSRHGTLPAAG